MAEMNVERKNRTYLWQLIIAALIIGLAILGAVVLFDGDSERAQNKMPDTKETVPATKVASVPVQVDKYISFIRDNPAQEKMDLDHAYTSDGIRRLADAIGAVVDQHNLSNPNITGDLDKLRSYADRLQNDQRSTAHADVIRDAFVLASGLLGSMQQKISPNHDAEVADVRRAAEAINSDELALQQKPEVGAFFKKAGIVLEDLAKSKG